MTDVKKLGRYEIIKELGRGGMGIVLLGRDPMIDRQVALKIIKLTDEEDISDSNKELLERFFIEAKAAGKLTHPNIVTIYDVGAEGGKSFMALEFIDGDDLAAVINKSGPMDLERAATIASQVADGLAFAHENGIIHRDIKPGNILVQGNDRVKITDFGLARLQTSHSLTQTGHAVGSPSYMSPEQVQGIHLDGRSDIFSLGVMFYEMVTAKRPFVGDSMSSLIFKIITDKPPLPSNLIEGIPKPVDAVISKMLAKSPDDRYQSCHEVKKAFDALAAGDVKAAELTTGAFGSVSGDVTVDFDTTAITGKKSGSKIGVIAGFAALIIAGVAFWFMLGQKGVEEKAIVPTAQPPKLARVEQKEPVKVEPKEPVKTEQKTPTETKKPAAVAATERASVAESPPVVKVSPPALSVTSKPSGAEVFIDKVSFGRTPLYTEKLEPGKRKVLLALKGYDKESRLVTLEDDKKTTLSITLNRSMGILKIGKPKGAQVFLDGKKIGAVPVVFNSKPGSYKLRLTLEGYHPYSSTVKIAAGKSVSPKVKLAKLGYGEINVFAIPWADIYINGKKSGTTPKLIKKALEGKTTIRLVNPGYRPFNTTVDVQKDKRVEVSHNFSDAEALGSAQDNDQKAEEATGSLAISSKPAGVVFINGKHYGTTPVKTKGLKKGVYTIVIKREGMPDYKRKVTVVEDIVTRLSIE